MNVATLVSILRERARLRSHDAWTRDELLAYQAGRLAELRDYAVAHSPFYRELHRGLTMRRSRRCPSRRRRRSWNGSMTS